MKNIPVFRINDIKGKKNDIPIYRMYEQKGQNNFVRVYFQSIISPFTGYRINIVSPFTGKNFEM